MGSHPRKHQLMDLAEALVRRKTPVSAETARHVAQCRRCAIELRAMRRSIEFMDEARDLSPSQVLTAQILEAARREQRNRLRSGRRTLVMTAKTMTYAAALTVIATFVFSAALETGAAAPGSETALTSAVSGGSAPVTGQSKADLRKTTARIHALSAAFNSRPRDSRSLREHEQLRAVLARGADISEALAALQQNPGCTRARYLVDTNLERQAEDLESLLAEQSL